MGFKRAAASLTIVFALATIPQSALASDKTDVVAAVHRYLDNLDKDKLETALAMCDSQVSILDEFPPHEWHGRNQWTRCHFPLQTFPLDLSFPIT